MATNEATPLNPNYHPSAPPPSPSSPYYRPSEPTLFPSGSKAIRELVKFAFYGLIFIPLTYIVIKWSPEIDPRFEPLGVCDKGYLIYKNRKCFLIIKAKVDFDEADLLCRKMYEADLLILSDKNETGLLLDLAQNFYGIPNSLWVKDGSDRSCKLLSNVSTVYQVAGQGNCDQLGSFVCQKSLKRTKESILGDQSIRQTIMTMENALVATREQLISVLNNGSHSKGCNSYDQSLCPPTVVKVPPNGNLIVANGLPFSLTCAAKSSQVTVVDWILPNNSVSSNQETLQVSKSSFDQNNGTYVCKVSNGLGPDVFESFNVLVVIQPKVSLERNEADASTKRIVIFSCTVVSNPDANILWLETGSSKGSAAQQVTHFPKNATSIAVMSVNIDNDNIEGESISCIAVNDVGTAQSDSIPIGSPPVAVFIDGGHQADSTHLVVHVVGSSPFGIKEFKIQYKLENHSHWDHVFITPNEGPLNGKYYAANATISVHSYGRFRVKATATNSYGWSPDSPVVEFTVKSSGGQLQCSFLLLFAALILIVIEKQSI